MEWHETRPTFVTADAVTFFYGAELPKTHYAIERAVTVRAGEPSVHVEEWVENRSAYDRPYNWNQHATFGAPFVSPEANVLDLSGSAALTDPRRTGGGNGPRPPSSAGRTRRVRRADRSACARSAPGPDGQVYTPVRTAAADALGWFTLYNLESPPARRLPLPRQDHPWIIDWQNRPDAGSPTRTARGIEFGTSPFDEGLRKSVERGRLFDTPTYRWIGARQRLSTTFQIFLTEVPPAFAGVEDVRASGRRITVRERGTGRELTVAPAGHADLPGRGLSACIAKTLVEEHPQPQLARGDQVEPAVAVQIDDVYCRPSAMRSSGPAMVCRVKRGRRGSMCSSR